MRRLSTIILDLDGTLTDSAPAMTDALNAIWLAAGRAGFDAAAVRSFIGDGPAALIARARAASGLADDAALTRQETAAFMAAYAAGPGGAAYPGAAETLAALRAAGFRLSVCTNKPQAAAEHLLAALGFAPYLAGVVGGDATPRCKPDPAHVRAALALTPGAEPEEAVLVGDGPQDVAAAEAAGVAAIVAAYGYGGAATLRPDLPVIRSIRELSDLLAGRSGAVAGGRRR